MSSLSVRADRDPVGTPPRPPRSLRRTTSHDVTWPEGLSGPMTAICRGRDLHTGPTGAATTARVVNIVARAGFDDGKVSHIATDLPGLDVTPLTGTAAFSGFRLAAAQLLPAEHRARSLAHQLLDDLPIAFLLGGRVLRAEGISLDTPNRRLPMDVCAGWVDGGSLLEGLDELGPPIHEGPPAPPLEREDDPVAWHELVPLPAQSTGRRRRLDVSFDNDVAVVDSWFRDTHVDASGAETVVHEYTVRAEFDHRTGRFLHSDAAPGPLPYVECPGAASSAGRLRDQPVEGLRDRVSTTFTGPSTCTHLNDALRGMEDLTDVIDTLEALDEPARSGRSGPHGPDERQPAHQEDKS